MMNRVRTTRTVFACNHRRPAREGYVLVVVVTMMFVLFGLAALLIDFGMVRLTQRQMLAATDAAAMEGLRWRDVQQWGELPSGWLNDPTFVEAVNPPPNPSPTGSITLAQADAIRRWAATDAVSLMMSSKTEDTADPVNYGFGPEVQFTPTTAGGGLAGPTVAPAQTPVYQPQLQTNAGNATSGDIVSGFYGPVQSGAEQSDYTRNDFSPLASSATAGATQPPSFLARMRRVAPGNSLDQQSGISSSGPAVPYLFGYGAAIDRSIVSQGVTVRGTSIASVGFNPANNPQISTSDPYYADYPTIGMANSVGWANPSLNQIGAVPVAIYSDPAAGNDQWSSLVSAGGIVTLTVAQDGTTLKNATNQSVGFLVNQTLVAPQRVVVIGQQATTGTVLPANQASTFIILVSAANQVIGFGAADSLSQSTTAGSPASITLTPVRNRVAWENASAMLVEPLASNVDATSLWTLRSAVQYPLYSPVLVNR
jgi:hypothetical protein